MTRKPDHYGSGAAASAGFTALGIGAYLLNHPIMTLDDLPERDINFDGVETYQDWISAFSLAFNAPGRWALGLLGDGFWRFFETDPRWPPMLWTLPSSILVYIAIIIAGALIGGTVWTGIKGGGGRLYSAIDAAPWKPASLSAGDIIIGVTLGTFAILGVLAITGVIG